MGTDLSHTPGRRRRGRLPGHGRHARPRHPASSCRGSPTSPPASPTSSATAHRSRPTCAAWCAARGERSPSSASPPKIGPELEFFLLEPDGEGGWRRHVDNLSMVYTVGPQADPQGVVKALLEGCAALGLGAIAVQPRVHEQPVRDQPARGDAARRRRPRLPLQGRGQGLRRPARAAGDVHGQAVQRPGRIRDAPAHLARARGRRTAPATPTTRPGSRPRCATSSAACSTTPRR